MQRTPGIALQPQGSFFCNGCCSQAVVRYKSCFGPRLPSDHEQTAWTRQLQFLAPAHRVHSPASLNQNISCSSLCAPSCGVAAPAPLADTTNEPCVRQCPDSMVVIQPPPSVATFPGPILSSFPQYSVAGLVGAPSIGRDYAGTSGGHGGFGGYEGSWSYGGLGGYRDCGFSGGYGGFGSCRYGGWGRGHRYLRGNCGSC
ncbi:uncharacterized protein RG961_012566 [Leptosomus discolor]